MSKPSASEPFLTALEVAAHLRVDVHTVRRWCARGDLEAFRIGQELRITPAALETFVSTRRLGGGAVWNA